MPEVHNTAYAMRRLTDPEVYAAFIDTIQRGGTDFFLQDYPSFTERLFRKLRQFGKITAQDNDDAAKELRRKVRESRLVRKEGVKLDFLGSWLNGKVSPHLSSSPETRTNTYKLAAALELNYEQTVILFEKILFAPSFYLRRKEEFLYYAFIRYRDNEEVTWYTSANRLFNRLQQEKLAAKEPEILPTLLVREELEKIAQNDEKLCQYIRNNWSDFDCKTNEMMTARDTIATVLLPECAVNIIAEIRKNKAQPDCDPRFFWKYIGENVPPDAEGIRAAVTDHTLACNDTVIDGIIGYRQRGNRQRGLRYPIAKISTLPKEITFCFPTGAILGEILNNSDVSMRQVVKCYKLLLFYYFFSTPDLYQIAQPNNLTEIRKRFDAFRELQQLTCPTGYQLPDRGETSMLAYNPEDPYDRLFLFSALQPDPINTLRSIIRSAVLADDKTKV